ncbi:MAG: hypothetical protein KGR18_07575 [Acidobacteria bacterium]|nr:hypothetical protein [Acidobacteriota bacterium]
MGRFANSKQLAGASWGVLKSDKELLAIPVIGGAVCAVIAAVIGLVVYSTLETTTDAVTNETSKQANPAAVLLLIIGVLVIAVISQLFAGALVAGANERLEGGDPTLGSAFSKATSRIVPIAGWTATNATVGAVLSAVQEKAGFLGDLVVGMIGAAWNIATWLVMPVIIIEGVGPFAAVKRSVMLIKAKWGENIIAQVGFGLLGLLLIVPGVIVFGALTAAVPFLGLPLLLIYLAVVFTVLSALGAIFRTALYRYAAGLPVGAAFSEPMLASSFGAKPAGRR